MMVQERPIVAVTMGDPAGIGPEIIVGVWPDRRVHERLDGIIEIVSDNPAYKDVAYRITKAALDDSKIKVFGRVMKVLQNIS